MQKLEQENLSQIYRMSEEVDLETRQIYLIGGGDGNAEVRNNVIYYYDNMVTMSKILVNFRNNSGMHLHCH